LHEQEVILHFIERIMGNKKRMNVETFAKINEEVSSEMVTTVMGAIHDNLPCSQNIFRMI